MATLTEQLVNRDMRALRNRARWIRHDDPGRIDVGARVRAGVWKGMLAGAGGVAVMTLGEKLEQRLTRRPSSYMPAHTLERVLGRRQRPDRERHALNLTMHFGQAILLGAWRGLMAEGGLRGPRASAMFTVIRLANDQTLENITGQGAPPWTWPRDEQVIDVLHKSVYAFTTGLIADALAEDPPAWQQARS
ncbi:MAG: hypothetical protein AVDCRST_MAG67-2092 [uncultured Solirubrobacteraceae bacterium]|uniref:Uncharacterized protein n=1 Tax=uncultured Solirubrobacteraceae bacterium TaxID=1162706 RepID=A0A6J4S5R3_9ACTN|nr:MAG: hypothetical protein AVDCRST_MAG67-2092 [uncultured Solirubrobacteraceae bacterium]